MDFLCRVCDRDNIEDESEYNKNLATLRKENDKNIYNTNNINKINLDDLDKISDDFVPIHNKKFNHCFFAVNLNYNSTIISQKTSIPIIFILQTSLI